MLGCRLPPAHCSSSPVPVDEKVQSTENDEEEEEPHKNCIQLVLLVLHQLDILVMFTDEGLQRLVFLEFAFKRLPIADQVL